METFTKFLKQSISEKNIVDKKQLQWVLKQAKSYKTLDDFIEDIELMIKMS